MPAEPIFNSYPAHGNRDMLSNFSIIPVIAFLLLVYRLRADKKNNIEPVTCEKRTRSHKTGYKKGVLRCRKRKVSVSNGSSSPLT